jgi:transposase
MIVSHFRDHGTLLAYWVGNGLVLCRTPCVIGAMLRGAASGFPFPAGCCRMEVVMSVQPGPWPDVPEETARVARAVFPRGSLPMRVRDELGGLFKDADLAGVYGARGRPGLSPAQLAVVTVLQFTENLTDRQAADAVRARIDWKYCLGLDLADQGFDFSVLSEFRARLVAGGQERLLLDLQLRRLKEAGLVAAGMRQRTDSTRVLARIRDLSRLELAGESVRAALEALAAAVPDWLASVIDASWQQAYGQRVCDLRLPEGKDARARLAERFARDGYHLLERVMAPGAPPAARDLPAMEALRLVLVQQFYRDDGPGGGTVRWREDGEDGLPPGRRRVVSPYDLDARYGEKRGEKWLGYKAHFSETASDPARDDPATGMPEFPGLVTNAETTHASVPDAVMTSVVHDHLEQAGLPPGEHLADSGYASADALLAARERGITLVAPLLADTSRQARAGGYTTAMFTIGWDARQVTCPQGNASSNWSPAVISGHDVIVVRFPASACRDCPARARCTTGTRNGRQLTIRPREVHEAVTAARAEHETAQWKARYAARAGVEGLMRQATHVTGIRRARYLGLSRTTLEHNIAAVAINLIRLDAWWQGTPPDRGHPGNLHRLDLAA